LWTGHLVDVQHGLCASLRRSFVVVGLMVQGDAPKL